MVVNLNATAAHTLLMIAIAVLAGSVDAQIEDGWDVAHATNYGSMNGSETMRESFLSNFISH